MKVGSAWFGEGGVFFRSSKDLRWGNFETPGEFLARSVQFMEGEDLDELYFSLGVWRWLNRGLESQSVTIPRESEAHGS